MVFVYIKSLTFDYLIVKNLSDALFLAKLDFQHILRELKSPETPVSIFRAWHYKKLILSVEEVCETTPIIISI